MIQGARHAGRNNEARMLTDLKHKLLGVIDDPKLGNPHYKAARDVYSSRAELLESLDEGRKFMRGDAEMTGAQYKALSTGEKRMFRVGMAREMRKALGSKQLGHDMVGIFDKPNTREVLGEIMSPAKAKKFYQLIDIEEALAETSRAVRGNSKTAQRQQDVLDFSFGVRLGRSIKDKGLKEALYDEIADSITRLFAMREGDAVRLTKALFETNPDAQRAILTNLTKTYGKAGSRRIVDRAERLARRQIANKRRALAGIAGEQANELIGQQAQ
jgi:predicted ATPase